jgi:hypothetical protein
VNPTTEIRVKVFVEVIFDFTHPSLYMGTLHRGDSATKYAFISVKDMAKAKIVDVTTSSPLITARHVEIPNRKENDNRFRIEVKVAPGLPDGNFNEEVTVHSNLEKMPKAVLKANGRVVGDLEIRPTSMTFLLTDPENKPHELTKWTTIYCNREDQTLEILSYKDKNDNLELKLTEQEAGRKFELRGLLKKESINQGPRFSGQIIVATNHPEYREILIDYHVVWRR